MVVALTVVSMFFNFNFGYKIGEGSSTISPLINDGWVFGILSIAADGLKICLGVLAVRFFMGNDLAMWSRALGFTLCTSLWALAAVYSLNSALGSVATHRVDMAASREKQAINYGDLKDELAQIRAQQKWLDEKYRAPKAIEAQMRGLEQDPLWGRSAACTNATVDDSRAFCSRYSALSSELATAQRADDLNRRADDIRAKINATKGITVADPHAAFVSEISGYKENQVMVGWLILIVVLVEGGSTFGPIAISLAAMAARKKKVEPLIPASREPLKSFVKTQVEAPKPQVVSTPEPIPHTQGDLSTAERTQEGNRQTTFDSSQGNSSVSLTSSEAQDIDLRGLVPARAEVLEDRIPWRGPAELREQQKAERAAKFNGSSKKKICGTPEQRLITRWMADCTSCIPLEIGEEDLAAPLLTDVYRNFEAWRQNVSERRMVPKRFSRILAGELDLGDCNAPGARRFNPETGKMERVFTRLRLNAPVSQQKRKASA